ncbi:MAG: GrpB family protein [Oscillospiraceae bacterium]
MARHVVVMEYDPAWAEKFETEAKKIKEILGENCVAIHHIGSTSVAGLAAKPIIDIMPVVRSLDAVDALASAFERIGYEYMGEFGIPGRRYLRKGGEEHTHHIHIFAESSTEDIERHLAVRDYLRTHKEVCDAYAALKKELAEKYAYDIDGYCDGKDAFVKRMEKEALRWSGGR